MLLVTRGIQSLARAPVHVPRGSRGLSFHVNIPTAQHFLNQSRLVFRQYIPQLSRIFGILRASSDTVTFSRVYPGLRDGIQQRLSFPSRVTLSRPLRAAGIPRPPVVARSVHEVGLGMARKFGTQTAFRHVIQNTSITARAFWEADWDIKATKERAHPRHVRKTRSKRSAIHKARTASSTLSDFEHYFPQSSTVVTVLQIALAPTPTSTVPLNSLPYDIPPLLPLRTLLGNHDAFQAHAHDISLIFDKLDKANVWGNGASLSSWGDNTGLCVELRIKFSGWTNSDVRELLGDLADLPSCGLQEYGDGTYLLAPTQPLFANSNDLPVQFVLPILASPARFNAISTSSPFYSNPSSSAISLLELEDGTSTHSYSNIEIQESHTATDFDSQWVQFSSSFLSRLNTS